MKKFILTLLLVSLFSSCSSVVVNGEARFRLSTVGELLKNCRNLKGKKIAVEGIYRGWNCPRGCKNPGITRSDSCISDDTGCIYISGTAGLDPISDRGKRVRIEGTVLESSGICYLKPERVDELR